MQINDKQMSKDEMYEFRQSMGLTQQKLAHLLGYSHRSIIAHFESGNKTINPRVAMLCHLLKEKQK